MAGHRCIVGPLLGPQDQPHGGSKPDKFKEAFPRQTPDNSIYGPACGSLPSHSNAYALGYSHPTLVHIPVLMSVPDVASLGGQFSHQLSKVPRHIWRTLFPLCCPANHSYCPKPRIKAKAN